MRYHIKKKQNPNSENTKKEKNVYKYLKNNIVRRWSNAFNGKYDLKTLMKSEMYSFLHGVYCVLICFVVVFSTNLHYLLISLIIVALDAISIIFLHQCPITMLERKFIGESDCDFRQKILTKLGISYDCDHIYEQQIEFIINFLFIIAMKCFLIMFMKSFNYKLNDDAMLYSQ
jgi:hypothetical protein